MCDLPERDFGDASLFGKVILASWHE